jgi:Ca2+-binding EF-hand superfamily protein
MSIRGKTILTTLAITLIGAAPASSQSLLKTLDPDNDGTVDLAEAKSAASKLFDKLDRDHDGTLDRPELRGRLNAKDFAAADPDTDGTLDKNEFLALVIAEIGRAGAHLVEGLHQLVRGRVLEHVAGCPGFKRTRSDVRSLCMLNTRMRERGSCDRMRRITSRPRRPPPCMPRSIITTSG